MDTHDAIDLREDWNQNKHRCKFGVLPWIPTLLTASRGRLLQYVVAYSLTIILAWALTFGTYWIANRFVLPLPDLRANVEETTSAIASRLGDKCDVDQKTQDVDGRSVTHSTVVLKDDDGLEFAELVVRHHAGVNGTTRLEATIQGTEQSDPSIHKEIVFVDQTTWTSQKMLGTFTISTPASVHAFEKLTKVFFADLEESSVASEAGFGLGDKSNEYQRALNDAFKDNLDSVAAATSLPRQFNGLIQAATFVVFFALMIQLFCRYWLYCHVESNVRNDPHLAGLWSPYESLDRTGITYLESIANDASQRVRRQTGALGTWFVSTYLDLYHAAAAAFLVAGDYNSVPTFVETRANAVADERNASLSFVKYLLWAIPTIGFVGTVVGIGLALLETVNVDSADAAAAAIAKAKVSSSIGVSFDTTLVALLLSLVAMLFYHVLIQLEDLIVLRAKTDAQQQFIRPGESITETELTRVMLGHIDDLKSETDRMKVGTDGWQLLLENMNEMSQRIDSANARQKAWPKMLVATIVVLATALVLVLSRPELNLQEWLSKN